MTGAGLSQAVPLSGWQNFYVILGSSAAALIGLTFIVITIAIDAGGGDVSSARPRLLGLRAFITPTAVHFGSALALAALLSVPGQTALSLAICLGAGGLAGLVYCGAVVRWMRQMSSEYKPFIADWMWSVVLPLGAYLSVLAAAGLLLERLAAALYIVGAVTLVLLFIGIHNAWDVVAWITTERHARRDRSRRAESGAGERAAGQSAAPQSAARHRS